MFRCPSNTQDASVFFRLTSSSRPRFREFWFIGVFAVCCSGVLFFFALSSCSCIRDIKINRYGIPLVETQGECVRWCGTAIWEFLCLLGNVSAGGVGAQNCTQRVFEREGRKPPFIPRCVKNASSCMSGGASECAAVGGCLVVLGKSSPCEIALQAMYFG